MKSGSVLFFIATFLVGCGQQGRMTQTTYSDSGQAIRTLYSDVYEARRMMVPDTLGVQVLVQDKKTVGFWHRMRQALGILGPDDLVSPATCVVLVFNRRTESIQVRISDVRLDGEDILEQPVAWDLKAIGQEKISISDLQIPSYGTQLNCELVMLLNGQKVDSSLVLRRLTEHQANQLFGSWSGRNKNVDKFFEVPDGTHGGHFKSHESYFEQDE